MYLKSRGLENIDELREELNPVAESRVKRALVLMQVSEQDDITVPPEEIQTRTREMIAQIHQYYPDADARRLTSGQPLQNMVTRLTSDLIIDRTLEHLRLIAKGEAPDKKSKDKTKKEKKPSKKTSSKKASAKKPSSKTKTTKKK
jgi:FKBP-type peptidyl-prolyl cis-trans isomerase (trigger factor)